MNKKRKLRKISHTLCLVIFVFLLAPSLFAKSLKNLEIQAWTAEIHELYSIEDKVIEHITKHNRYNPLGYSILSHIHLRRYTSNPNNLHELKEAFQHALHSNALDKKYDYGKSALANVLYLQTSFDSAFETLKKSDGQIQTWRSMFSILRMSEDKKSIDTLVQSTEEILGKYKGPKSVIYPYVMSQLSSKPNTDKVNSAFKKWETKYPHVSLDHGFALFSMDKGFYETSNRLFEKARSKDPKNFDFALNHAVLLYKYLKQYEKSNKIMNALKNTPSTEHRKSILLFNQGLLNLEQSHDMAARKTFKELFVRTNVNKDFVQTIFDRYQSKNKLNEFTAMMLDYSQTVRGYGWVYGFLGEINLQEMKRPHKALAALNNAVTIEPANWKYHSNLGLALYQTNKVQSALDSFMHATHLNPDDSISHYNKACMFSILNRNQEAVDALQDAFDLDDSLVASAKGDEDLKNIHRDGMFLKLLDKYRVAH